MAISVSSLMQDTDTTYTVAVMDSVDGKEYRASFDIRDGVAKVIESLKSQIVAVKADQSEITNMKTLIESGLNAISQSEIDAQVVGAIGIK